MGYNNIEKILSNSEKLKDINKIIVQSNTDVVKLRKSVIKLGFKITREKSMKFWIEIILAIIISLTPIVCIYNITLWKDILYSYYLLNL